MYTYQERREYIRKLKMELIELQREEDITLIDLGRLRKKIQNVKSKIKMNEAKLNVKSNDAKIADANILKELSRKVDKVCK